MLADGGEHGQAEVGGGPGDFAAGEKDLDGSDGNHPLVVVVEADEFEIAAGAILGFVGGEFCRFGVGFAEGVDGGEQGGDFVEVYLGIDPFFYFERLYTLPEIPPLIYSWRINSIGQQTAPFIETREPSGQKVMIRDEKKLGYKAIGKTDAWKDDGGNAEYVLNCTRLDVTPKFESATAT